MTDVGATLLVERVRVPRDVFALGISKAIRFPKAYMQACIVDDAGGSLCEPSLWPAIEPREPMAPDDADDLLLVWNSAQVLAKVPASWRGRPSVSFQLRLASTDELLCTGSCPLYDFGAEGNEIATQHIALSRATAPDVVGTLAVRAVPKRVRQPASARTVLQRAHVDHDASPTRALCLPRRGSLVESASS